MISGSIDIWSFPSHHTWCTCVLRRWLVPLCHWHLKGFNSFVVCAPGRCMPSCSCAAWNWALRWLRVVTRPLASPWTATCTMYSGWLQASLRCTCGCCPLGQRLGHREAPSKWDSPRRYVRVRMKFVCIISIPCHPVLQPLEKDLRVVCPSRGGHDHQQRRVAQAHGGGATGSPIFSILRRLPSIGPWPAC